SKCHFPCKCKGSDTLPCGSSGALDVMKPSQCIWCLQSAGGKHVEHIVPEALGCPKGFVLTADQICQRCNNGLGYLAQAVADDFDFVGFLAGVTRKKRKAPGIMSRGNVYGFMGRDGPEIIFN